MIQLTEEQVGRLLAGRAVTISVGEPWNFESPDGENTLRGRILGAFTDEADSQSLEIEVTPFLAEGGREIDRLVARVRYEDSKGIIEHLAAGEDAEVNLDYWAQIPEEERDPHSSPFLIGGVRLTEWPKGVDVRRDESDGGAFG